MRKADVLARKRGAVSSSWVPVSQAAAVEEGESPHRVPAVRGEAAAFLLFLPHLSAQQGSRLGPGLAGQSGEAGAGGGVLATVTTRAPLSVGTLVTLALLHRHPATPLLDAVSVLRKENCPRCSSPDGAGTAVPVLGFSVLWAPSSSGRGQQAALGAARRLRGCRQVAGAMKSLLMDGGGRGFVQRAEQTPRCEIPASSQELVTISKQFPVRVLSSESP